MKKFIFKAFILVSMAFLVAACTARGPVNPLPVFQPEPFNSSKYTPKVNNFLVILDASSSMGEFCNSQEKFTIAKEFVNRMNQTIPEMGQTMGLRSFGHDPSISKKPTMLVDGMKPYNTSDFAKELDLINVAGGTSPLYSALCAAKGDLDGILTKTAVIVVSDGKANAGRSIDAATKLKEKFGSSLCIYTVLVGQDTNGMALMEKIADVGGCGFYAKAQDLVTGPAMADFVEKVFLTKREEVKHVVVAKPMDSDGDGVLDPNDKCPNTPQGVSVDAFGCPFDSDKDGVYDYEDQCPGTPLGAKVNSLGCWILAELLFDYDKAEIKPSSFDELNSVAVILKKNPGLNIDLQGHTDNKGSKQYNQKLSMRRANAVKKYLISHGISSDRLTTRGFGFSKPVATNKTEEGRAMNRRVELQPSIQ